ncbi:hypothetical protein J6590_012814 [Homalodisca vitripennis]|nr:hypothetical protein J6590_012814 [Homalodisca vitripennis]
MFASAKFATVGLRCSRLKYQSSHPAYRISSDLSANIGKPDRAELAYKLCTRFISDYLSCTLTHSLHSAPQVDAACLAPQGDVTASAMATSNNWYTTPGIITKSAPTLNLSNTFYSFFK